MKFEYNGKQYDIRLQARYLPKELQTINKLDMALLLCNRAVDKVFKQTILTEYLPTARVI